MGGKKWTDKDIENLESCIGNSYESISKRLSKSINSIKIKKDREGIKLNTSLKKHDYITKKDFLKEMKVLYNIRPYIIIGLMNKNIITTHKMSLNSTILITLDIYDKWKNFFSEYIFAWDASKELKSLNTGFGDNILYHWILDQGLIEYVRITKSKLNQKKSSIWLKRDSYNKAKDIMINYLTINDISILLKCSRYKLDKWVNNGKILYINFAGRRRINKLEIQNIKKLISN